MHAETALVSQAQEMFHIPIGSGGSFGCVCLAEHVMAADMQDLLNRGAAYQCHRLRPQKDKYDERSDSPMRKKEVNMSEDVSEASVESDCSSEPCVMPCHYCICKFDIRAPHMPQFRLDVCRMILCEHCGNKRCPHATDHRLECTSSNEPGQDGSV